MINDVTIGAVERYTLLNKSEAFLGCIKVFKEVNVKYNMKLDIRHKIFVHCF